ncbi:MAG: hypothetical protein WDZ82_02865 [Candidatus Paceibacterota bacterium]
MALAAIDLCSAHNQKGWVSEIKSQPLPTNGELEKLRVNFESAKQVLVEKCIAHRIPVPEFTARDVYNLVAQ